MYFVVLQIKNELHSMLRNVQMFVTNQLTGLFFGTWAVSFTNTTTDTCNTKAWFTLAITQSNIHFFKWFHFIQRKHTKQLMPNTIALIHVFTKSFILLSADAKEVPNANITALACSPLLPALPISCQYLKTLKLAPQCITCCTFVISTPIPKAIVVTTHRNILSLLTTLFIIRSASTPS